MPHGFRALAGAMHAYLYLSLIPEALIASHLSPAEFGSYLAVGPKNRSRGPAMFFSLSPEYRDEIFRTFRVDPSLDRQGPHNRRRSLYLGVYRVLEHTPVKAMLWLHLATVDGRVLTLSPEPYVAPEARRFYLYQELCPATPRIVSVLAPHGLGQRLTDPAQRVHLPAVVYADLRLDAMAHDPEAENTGDLAYANLGHLRDCLRELQSRPEKTTKVVIRFLHRALLFRMLQHGFYVAAQEGAFRFFPMPGAEALETTHAKWWKSAHL